MLIEPEQHDALRARAEVAGLSVAEITRLAIRRGLETLDRDAARASRARALDRARNLRRRLERRQAAPYPVDEALDELREGRSERLADRRR
jgi:hypothetical protein